MVKLIHWLKTHTFLSMTYQWEAIMVSIILIITGLLSDKGWVEWIGVLAVFFTFMHASVAERLAESEGHRKTNGEDIYVDCYYKLPRYFYLKELCFFFIFHSWEHGLLWLGCLFFLPIQYGVKHGERGFL